MLAQVLCCHEHGVVPTKAETPRVASLAARLVDEMEEAVRIEAALEEATREQRAIEREMFSHGILASAMAEEGAPSPGFGSKAKGSRRSKRREARTRRSS